MQYLHWQDSLFEFNCYFYSICCIIFALYARRGCGFCSARQFLALGQSPTVTVTVPAPSSLGAVTCSSPSR